MYDLEFLQDDKGRRVAAFGFHAGFAGAAVGVLAWADQLLGKTLGVLEPYPNEGELIEEIKKKVEQVKGKIGRNPRALVIGALGRCGRGAVDLFLKAGFQECAHSSSSLCSLWSPV